MPMISTLNVSASELFWLILGITAVGVSVLMLVAGIIRTIKGNRKH